MLDLDFQLNTIFFSFFAINTKLYCILSKLFKPKTGATPKQFISYQLSVISYQLSVIQLSVII